MSIANARVGASLGALVVTAAMASAGLVPDAAWGQGNRAAGGGSWTAPRTPWGDPDISGDFTNKYEIGTPFERPLRFEGRTLDSFTPDEIQELALERQELVLLNYPHQFDATNPAGNLGGPNTWGDRFEIFRGSRPWFVIDPPDGQIPEMTPAGRERAAQERATRTEENEHYVNGPEAPWGLWMDQQNASLYDRCISRGYPGSMMPVSYGNSYHILQTPDYVAVRYEMVHEARIIPLDGRAHAPESVRTYMGNARGRWEGDTLVVETTNLRTGYRGANPETLKVTERFRRIAPNVVDWQVTIDDPDTWTRPWTFGIPLTQNENERVQEYACHAGNYHMPMRLRAARRAEIDAAAAGFAGRPPALREILLDEDQQRIERELREREDELAEIRAR